MAVRGGGFRRDKGEFAEFVEKGLAIHEDARVELARGHQGGENVKALLE
jgi:hypothetical protein